MLALLQRVKWAKVTVAEQIIGEIQQGLLVFLAVEPEDNEAVAERLWRKILNYRLFADQQDRMNLSVQDINGGVLLVPQFTLAANTSSGLRPSFSSAATPQLGEQLFNYIVEQARQSYANIATGQFAANMQVSLCNDGPVTFLLR